MSNQDEYDNDNIDLDSEVMSDDMFDDMNFDELDDLSPKKDDRSPIAVAFSTFKSEVKNELKQPSNYGSFLDKALPHQLQAYKYDVSDAMMNVSSGISDIAEQRGHDISNLFGSLGMNRVQNAFNKKYTDNQYHPQSSGEEIEERLNDVFSENQEREREANERDETLEKLKMSQSKGAHLESMTVSHSAVAELKNINSFNNSITYQYQRANLETGLRSYDMQKKILKATMEYSEAEHAMLKAIVLNTSLPDSRKTRNSESLMGSITGGAKDNFLKGFTNDGGFSKTLGNLTSQKVSGLIGSVLDKKDQFDMMMNSGASPMELGMAIASGMVVEGGMNFAGTMVKKSGVLSSKKVVDGINTADMKLDTFKQDSLNQARTMAMARDSDGAFKASFRSVLKEFLPGQEFDDGVFGGVRLRAVNTQDAVIKAQTVVIPTLLSKILSETVAIRTGGEPSPQLRFDYSTSRFREGPGRVVSSLTKLERKFNRVDNLNEAADQADTLLTNGTKAELAALSESLVNAGIQSVGRQGQITTLEDFLASSAFTNLPPALRQSISVKLEGQEESVYRAVRKIKSTTAVPLNVIKELVQNQQHAPLLDKGILIEKDGILTIDEKAYTKWLNATSISNFLSRGDVNSALAVDGKKTADVNSIMSAPNSTKNLTLSNQMRAQYGMGNPTGNEIDPANPSKVTAVKETANVSDVATTTKKVESAEVLDKMRGRIAQKMGDMVFDQHIKDGRAGLNKLASRFGIKTQNIPITNALFAPEVIDTVRGITPKTVAKAAQTVAKAGKEKLDNIKSKVMSKLSSHEATEDVRSVKTVASRYATVTKRIISAMYGKKLMDVDVYTKTSDEPVILYNKLSSGEYMTDTSAITSMSDVMKAKTPIFNKAGHMVVTATDIKEGLFTRNGIRLTTGFKGVLGKISHVQRRIRSLLFRKPLEMLGFDMSTKGGRQNDTNILKALSGGVGSLKKLHGKRKAHKQNAMIAKYRDFARDNGLILPKMFDDDFQTVKTKVLTYVDHLTGKFVKVVPGQRPPKASTIGFMENGKFTALGDKASSLNANASVAQIKRSSQFSANTHIKRNVSKRYKHRNTEAGYTAEGLYISKAMAAENRRRMEEDDGSILGRSTFASRQIGADGRPPELRGPTRVRRASQMLYEAGALNVKEDSDYNIVNRGIHGTKEAIKQDLGTWIVDPDMKDKIDQKKQRLTSGDRITADQQKDLSEPLDKRSHPRFKGNDALVHNAKIGYDNDQVTHTSAITTLVKRSADDSRLTVQLPQTAMSSEQVRDLIASSPLDQTNKLSYVFKTPNIKIDTVSSGPNIQDPDDELGIAEAREIRIKRYQVAKDSFNLFHKQAMHDKWKRVIDRIRWARESAKFVNMGIDKAKATYHKIKTRAEVDILRAKIAILAIRWRVNPSYIIGGLGSTADVLAATSLSTLGQILAELRNNRLHEQARWSNIAGTQGIGGGFGGRMLGGGGGGPGGGDHANPPFLPGVGNGYHNVGSPHYRNGPQGNNYGWRETARQRLDRNRRNRRRRYNGDDEDGSFDRWTTTQAARNMVGDTIETAKDTAIRLALLAVFAHNTKNAIDDAKERFLPAAINNLIEGEDKLKDESYVDKAYTAAYSIPNLIKNGNERAALHLYYGTKNWLSRMTGFGDNAERIEEDRLIKREKIRALHDEHYMTDKHRYNRNVLLEIERKEEAKKIITPLLRRVKIQERAYREATDMNSAEGLRLRKWKSLKERKHLLLKAQRELEEAIELHVTSVENKKSGTFGLLQKDPMSKAVARYLSEIKANPYYVTSTNVIFKGAEYFLRDLKLGVSIDQQPYNQMRVAQYGFGSNEHHVDILKFEQYLASTGFFFIRKSKVETNMAKMNPIILGILFGLKEGAHAEHFLSWYENRFIPIIAHHKAIMFDLDGTIDLNNFSKLSVVQKTAFLAATRFDPSFDISNDNPFGRESLEPVAGIVNKMWNSISAEITNQRNNASKSDPDSPRTNADGSLMIPYAPYGADGNETPKGKGPIAQTLDGIAAEAKKIHNLTSAVGYVADAAKKGGFAAAVLAAKAARSARRAANDYQAGTISVRPGESPAAKSDRVGPNQHLKSSRTELAKEEWRTREAARTKGSMLGLSSALSKYKKRTVSPEMTLRVIRAIDRAALATGLDPHTMRNVALIESSLDPFAENVDTGAKGVFQFLSGTWNEQYSKKNRKKFGIGNVTEFNPEANAMLACNYVSINVAKLEAITGQTLTEGQAYSILFMGPGGSRTLYRRVKAVPNEFAYKRMKLPAQYNPGIFYVDEVRSKPRTYAQVMVELERRSGVGNNVPWLHKYYPLQPHEDGYYKTTSDDQLQKDSIKHAEHQKLVFQNVHTFPEFRNKAGTVTLTKSKLRKALLTRRMSVNGAKVPLTLEQWERQQTWDGLVEDTPKRNWFHTESERALATARRRMGQAPRQRSFTLSDIKGIGTAKGADFDAIIDGLDPRKNPQPLDPFTGKPRAKSIDEKMRDAYYERFIANDPMRMHSNLFRGSRAERARRGARVIVEEEYTDHAKQYIIDEKKKEAAAKLAAEKKVAGLVADRVKKDTLATSDRTGEGSISQLIPGFLTMNRADKYQALLALTKEDTTLSPIAQNRLRLYRQMMLVAPYLNDAERQIDRALRGAEIIDDNVDNITFVLPQVPHLGTLSEIEFKVVLVEQGAIRNDQSVWDLSTFTLFAINANKALFNTLPSKKKTEEMIERLQLQKQRFLDKYGELARYEIAKIDSKLKSLQHTLLARAAQAKRQATKLASQANTEIIQPSIANAQLLAQQGVAAAQQLKEEHMYTATQVRQRADAAYASAKESYHEATHGEDGSYHAATPAQKEAWATAQQAYAKSDEAYEKAKTNAATTLMAQKLRAEKAGQAAINYGLNAAGEVKAQVIDMVRPDVELTTAQYNALSPTQQVEYVAARAEVTNSLQGWSAISKAAYNKLSPHAKEMYDKAKASASARSERFMSEVEYRSTQFVELSKAQFAQLTPRLKSAYLVAKAEAYKHSKAAKTKVRDYMKSGLSSFVKLSPAEFEKLSQVERLQYLQAEDQFNKSSVAQLAADRFESGKSQFMELTATQYAQLSDKAKVLYNKGKLAAARAKDSALLGTEQFVELSAQQYARLSTAAKYKYDATKARLIALRGEAGVALNYGQSMGQQAYGSMTGFGQGTYNDALSAYDKGQEVYRVNLEKLRVIAREKLSTNAKLTPAEYSALSPADRLIYDHNQRADGNLELMELAQDRVSDFTELSKDKYDKLTAQAQVAYLEKKQKAIALGLLTRDQALNGINRFATKTKAQIAAMPANVRSAYYKSLEKAQKLGLVARQGVEGYVSSFVPLSEDEFGNLQPQAATAYVQERTQFYTSTMSDVASERFSQAQGALTQAVAHGQTKAQFYADKLQGELSIAIMKSGPNSPMAKKLRANLQALKGNVMGIAYSAMTTITNPATKQRLVAALREQANQLAAKIGPTSDIVNALRNKANRIEATIIRVKGAIVSTINGAVGKLSQSDILKKLAVLRNKINQATSFYGANSPTTLGMIAEADELRSELDEQQINPLDVNPNSPQSDIPSLAEISALDPGADAPLERMKMQANAAGDYFARILESRGYGDSGTTAAGVKLRGTLAMLRRQRDSRAASDSVTIDPEVAILTASIEATLARTIMLPNGNMVTVKAALEAAQRSQQFGPTVSEVNQALPTGNYVPSGVDFRPPDDVDGPLSNAPAYSGSTGAPVTVNPPGNGPLASNAPTPTTDHAAVNILAQIRDSLNNMELNSAAPTPVVVDVQLNNSGPLNNVTVEDIQTAALAPVMTNLTQGNGGVNTPVDLARNQIFSSLTPTV